MNVLIVEDEELAASELQNMLKQIDSNIEVLAILGTIESAVDWLNKNSPDIIFMDIHLGDGESFEIFQQTSVKCPVIFTTAYDQYALEAFKNQGIDYLLKPFDKSDVEQALKKYSGLTSISSGISVGIASPLAAKPAAQPGRERNRFMVSLGSRLRTVDAEEIAYFMAEGKYLYLFTRNGESYILEETITSLAPQLSMKNFFRINRKFIIHIQSIKEMLKLSRNRIRIQLSPPPPGNIMVVVSEDRAEEFRSWLNL
ncbi:LytR/AlgR family response regulator transcription factor [Desertivirga xinjiangensis]|uniref:LytR/AlgR family response regulator transcription factor n=1 Tax=Desertivirga xinjiangensis TaxID=539206 RepID=UPI00210A7B91|nr:LytTR family DNA-binding domain-containing protein [Pedobacter xinjiangensis]